MNQITIVYFTEGGHALAEQVARILGCAAKRPKSGQLMTEIAQLFHECDALVFIGACGIAVRAIAPLLEDKTRDPAVVVMDECGQYVISLLSGHIGGANHLARRIAGITGGKAVITTATDVNRRFSIDTWAVQSGCDIESMEMAKRFSAEILKRDLPFCTDFPVTGALPSGLFAACEGDIGAAITYRTDFAPFAKTLQLIPRILYLGIGCRRGTTEKAIEIAVQRVMDVGGLNPRALKGIATIDVKRDEQGLLAFASEWHLPLMFFSAQELQNASGEFSSSSFVEQTVGVDNVCARAAICAAGENAVLLARKTVGDGVTVAIAQEKWRVCFG